MNGFPLRSLLAFAVRTLDVPDLLWIVGLVSQFLFLLALPIGLLHPERAILSLNALLLGLGRDHRRLVVIDLLVVLATAVQHLVAEARVLVIHATTSLLATEPDQVIVADHLVSGLSQLGRASLQAARLGVRVQQMVDLRVQSAIVTDLGRHEGESRVERREQVSLFAHATGRCLLGLVCLLFGYRLNFRFLQRFQNRFTTNGLTCAQIRLLLIGKLGEVFSPWVLVVLLKSLGGEDTLGPRFLS